MSSATEEKNFLAIKRLDQLATEIITKSTNASVFNFDPKKGDWVRANIEGSLFIYRRLDKPFHSIIVANRNSRNDFILPINDSLMFKYMPPYIYMFSQSGFIKALYLYGEDECKRVLDLLLSLQNPDAAKVVDQLDKLNISTMKGDVAADVAKTKNAKIKNAANKEKKTNEAKEPSRKNEPTFVKSSKSKESVKKATTEKEEVKNPSSSFASDEAQPKPDGEAERNSEGDCNAYLSKIQSVDVFADEVLTRTFYVDVRTFDEPSLKWVRDGVCGEMFIYRRLDRPLYSIIVFDKEDSTRFVQPITTALKFKYENTHIRMQDRNGLNKSLLIHCPKERKRIGKILGQIQKSLHSISKEVYKNLKFSES